MCGSFIPTWAKRSQELTGVDHIEGTWVEHEQKMKTITEQCPSLKKLHNLMTALELMWSTWAALEREGVDLEEMITQIDGLVFSSDAPPWDVAVFGLDRVDLNSFYDELRMDVE